MHRKKKKKKEKKKMKKKMKIHKVTEMVISVFTHIKWASVLFFNQTKF